MTSNPRGPKVFALIFIIIGALMILNNLGVTSFDLTIGTWWPLILVIIGLQQLFSSRFTNLFPLIIILIGVALQLRQLELIEAAQLRLGWPLLLILFGLILLFGFQKRGRQLTETSAHSIVDTMVFFGSVERQIASPSFHGGNATAFFGGAKLDLTGSQLAEGVQILNIQAFFGGVELILPEDWIVEIRGVPLFGGIEDKRRKPATSGEEPKAKLLINSVVAFGGIEIKSF